MAAIRVKSLRATVRTSPGVVQLPGIVISPKPTGQRRGWSQLRFASLSRWGGGGAGSLGGGSQTFDGSLSRQSVVEQVAWPT